jgi:ubiquinone/menaquinone biosynthesis C-methylase UbiE
VGQLRTEIRALSGGVSRVGDTPLAPKRPRQPREYVERNRHAWNRWAPQHAGRGRKAWGGLDLPWGLWDTPEAKLQLLRDLPAAADVIELGCGTAAVSAWVARGGMHPVAVDISREQLNTAAQLQREFGISFPLVCENAEEVPYDNASFDAAISEYGASLWCDPQNWLPEAHRLLKPGGLLLFFANAAFLMACTPYDGGAAMDVLVRDYYSGYQLEFPEENAVEFHLSHGHWIRMLRTTGFVVENLIEVRPPRSATPRFAFVSVEWARRWPSEEIWVARKAA